MTRREQLAWILAAAAVAAVLVLSLRMARNTPQGKAADVASVAPSSPPAKRILYWYDPMVPDQHFDKPGKSPFMDMQLVPKYADAAAGEPGIAVPSQVRQNLGVRTALATHGRLASTLQAPGTVAWNLRNERLVSLPVDAVVERLFVSSPFEPVRAGQPLASVRAPAWSTALAELQVLGSSESAEARRLQAAARQHLRALGLPASARADATGAIVVKAPVAGVVREIAAREGQALAAGMPMMRINGMETVWIEVALPPSAAGVGPDTAVDVALGDGTHVAGRVQALLPQVDANTRTQQARVELQNPGRRLAPGKFVQVTLRTWASAATVLVPSEAIITDGEHARVIVMDGERFRPVAVRTGRSGGGRTEVLSGLAAGERVVTSGQFLIDSEARLSGALERMDASEPHRHPAGETP